MDSTSSPQVKKIILLILILPLLAGCQENIQKAVDIGTGIEALNKKVEADEHFAKINCIKLCEIEMAAGSDLSSGPCLGGPLVGIPDWVCDVAHNPRQKIDNDPENQCLAFRQKKAKHFVEVDPDCNFIRSY